MKYLLDTHYVLWSLLEPGKINEKIKEILEDPDKIKNISKISFWEISLKYKIGKLELNGITPEDILAGSQEAGFEIYNLSVEDIASSYKLPFIDNHRDPFDRLIIWQCMQNDLIMITADEKIKEYGKFNLKLLV
ncbi:MAG: type II toxin-antitoxin system VapC family toxin [Spirochaetales bacterium]|nr:type II toxin-antitoxin system VapC family toxin [Spirochaetales bacterium]